MRNTVIGTKKNQRGHLAVLLLVIFISAMMLSSCENGESGITDVTLVMQEEKKIGHTLVDSISRYEYTAECISHPKAQGETDGYVPMFVRDDGTADLGYMENGRWKFDVKAYNLKGLLIYQGSNEVYVSGNTLQVPIALALNKIGEGTVRFTIDARCSGNDIKMRVEWKSYDNKENGRSEDFKVESDGDMNHFTGSIKLPENRYKLTISTVTPTAIITTEVVDVLVLNTDTIDVSGLLEGSEDQFGSLSPLLPKIPCGDIKVEGQLWAGKQVKASWVSREGYVVAETVTWYLDGKELEDKGLSISVTLPNFGNHMLSATATAGTEQYSTSYQIDMHSSPITAVGGTIVYDRGEVFGKYWFDEYGEHYRVDEPGDGWRYMVAVFVAEGDGSKDNPFITMMKEDGSYLTSDKKDTLGRGDMLSEKLIESMGEDGAAYQAGMYWYRLAPAVLQEYRAINGDEWVIPSKKDAEKVAKAMKKGEMEKHTFWSSTENRNNMSVGNGNSGSTQNSSKSMAYGLVLVKYI